jgi:putative iron-regulated protein
VSKKICILSFCLSISLFFGCKKNTPTSATSAKTTAGTVLTSEANVVLIPTSVTLANAASMLYGGAVMLQTTPNSTTLASCRQLWLNASAAYEQSAASLFGPDGSLGADPSSVINTYPIDTAGINQILNSTAVITLDYVDSLPTYLTGFHGIEFVLYGINGNKTAGQFTAQQLSYIVAVSLNIKTLTGQVDTTWSTTYDYQFANAGNGSSIYPTQTAAFSDLTMGIANICETDGIYKLLGIFNNKSTILQESPFANNSVTDIVNNLVGVQNIYYGVYNGAKGTGLSAFVSQNDVSLDLKIKTDLSSAIKAVNSITLPLSQAVYSQTSQVNAAANACDSLDDDLKVDLLTYLNANTN